MQDLFDKSTADLNANHSPSELATLRSSMSKIVDKRMKRSENVINSTVNANGKAIRQQMQCHEQNRQKDRDDDRRHIDKRLNALEDKLTQALTPHKLQSKDDTVALPVIPIVELSSLDASKSTDLTETTVSKSSVSRGELNIANDRLKKAEEKNKALEQELRSTEMELKQEKERSRTYTATNHSKKLAAKVRIQQPTETTEKSMIKHSARISGALSASKSRRSVLEEEIQTISNPALRRSARNMNKSN